MPALLLPNSTDLNHRAIALAADRRLAEGAAQTRQQAMAAVLEHALAERRAVLTMSGRAL